jgi:hypothetical protein
MVEGYGTYLWTTGNGNGHIQVGREDGYTNLYHLILQELGGNVGIGTTKPAYKLHVEGTMYGDLKMKTPRTIWGQSFDGTNDVSGVLFDVNQITFDRNKAYGIFQGNYFSGALLETDLAYYAAEKHIFFGGNVGIETTSPKSKLSVHTYIVESISAGYLGTSNTFGFGNMVEGYGTYLWTTGNGNGHIQVGREDGYTTLYHLILQELGGNVGIGESNPTDKLHVAGNLRLKTNSNYGCSLYFGDGEYFYLRKASDDQLTIHAGKLIIDNNTIINGNLVVRGGITMYGTDGSATDFLLDVTSWSSINSTSVNQVYTARATKLLKDQVSALTTECNKIAAIKNALRGISSSSSTTQIGAALNAVYNNI